MSISAQVNLGIIGAGAILESHIKALAQVPFFGVVGVCDTDEARRERTATALGARGFASYGELLASGPEVVLVALPHGLHCEVSVAALEAGCHVLVEKPMAVSVGECRSMLRAARQCNRVLMVAEASSFQPGPVRTGEWFSRGDLGRFFTGSIINERFYFHAERPDWFLDPAMSGGGMFSNVGLHRLAVTRACLPGLVPTAVSASVAHQPDWQVEACTTALVRYAEGGCMVFEEVGYYPKPEWLNTGTHYIFEQGIVSWDAQTWRLVQRDGREVVEGLAPDPQYRAVYERLQQAISGEDVLSGAGEYAQDIAIVRAAYASSHEQREIDLRSAEWRIP